ncbi:MAG: hypothetical protein GY795_36045 [Desulfobacterales bacterium]|nr:hypothetical protein [Desulfobacterales bacterium]
MNPYDFVPIDFKAQIVRRPPVLHGKFQGISGKLEAKITAETPVFVKSGNSEQFIKNKAGNYIVPGTSLKGLFRSIVETVANGCFCGKFDRKYSRKLPASYLECTNDKKLCIGCRIFGMLYGGKVCAGKVSFEDAVCNNPVSHRVINTIDLMGPKPHHTAFYLDPDEKFIAGRKFYFHHPSGIKTKAEKTKYNQRINPLDIETEFAFTAGFTNLENDEWQALLYAIVLEPEMRHKIGYAKPSGLGSVKIEITRIKLVDYAARYTSLNRGISEYQGQALSDYLAEKIQTYINNKTSQTLNEFRRIWHWDVNDTTPYRYPTTDWFKNNPNVRISQTP